MDASRSVRLPPMLCDTVALICMADACPWVGVGVVELYPEMALAKIATTIIAAIAAVRHPCRLLVVSLFGVLVCSFSLGWSMIALGSSRIQDGIYVSPPSGKHIELVELMRTSWLFLSLASTLTKHASRRVAKGGFEEFNGNCRRFPYDFQMHESFRHGLTGRAF